MTEPTYDDKRPSIPAEVRRSVEVESGHCCAIKGCNEHTYLEIHHIDENRENNSIENLILLCDKHHKMAHAKVIDRKALRKYKGLLAVAKRRRLPIWTEFMLVDAKSGVPTIATTAKIQFRLWSEYEDVPLIIRIASDAEGKFCQEVSGPSGIVELMMRGSQSFYVSLSNPGIQYEIGIVGWSY